MPRTSTTPSAPPEPPYDRDALFRPDGPLNPVFINDTLRSLMRALPHDPDESDRFRTNRMYGSLCALSGMYPRDEIEMMYAAAAVMAFHASAACYRLGMNGAQPNGENTRHITAAGSSIRTFDSLIKGLERRQTRPMAMPQGPRDWSHVTPADNILLLERLARGEGETLAAPPIRTAPNQAPQIFVRPIQEIAIAEPVWTPEMIRNARADLDRDLPPAIEGVQPDGSIIVPENPTPEQEAYIVQRLLDNSRADVRSGGRLRIPPIRAGDRIP